MQIKVVPTRMELLRLRKRLELAQRGHKLLQDKLEGLIKEFMPLVDEYVKLREEVDHRIPSTFAVFARASVESDGDEIRTSLGQTGLEAKVEISEVRLSSVTVPAIKTEFQRNPPYYSLLSTPRRLDDAVAALVELMPMILKTVEKEESVRRLAEEIERTRRRVNALEYIMIPRLKEARKFIQAKLDEDERASRVRNMKVKELLEKAAASME